MARSGCAPGSADVTFGPPRPATSGRRAARRKGAAFMSTCRVADVRLARGIALAALSLLALLALPGSALAGDTRKVFAMDRCDQPSFDAAVEPGTCVRNGGVKFDQFARRLNPKDGGHTAWRFSRHDVDLKSGQHLRVTNTGGETHTFTEVIAFG